MMRTRKQLLYAICIGLVFLVMHLFMAQFQFDNTINFIVSTVMMLFGQVAAFSVLRKKTSGNYSFKSLLIFLCLTQIACVLFLTLNAFLNPYESGKPVVLSEVLLSLLLFGIVFPVLVSILIWFGFKKRDAA